MLEENCLEIELKDAEVGTISVESKTKRRHADLQLLDDHMVL